MGYAKKNLGKNEKIIKEGRLSWACVLVGIIWFPPILAFFARLLNRFTGELTLTSNRLVGKMGIIKSASLDSKLDKIQSVSVSSGLWGKIFGYGNIEVKTAASTVIFKNIGGAEKLKQLIMAQIDIAQEEKMKEQAAQMAAAMASAIKA